MTEEEIFKNVWNETHHFKLTLANGEILDLIDLKFYTDLLGKYSEIKAENEKLKKEVEIKHDGFMASIDDVCEYAKENDKLRSVIDNAIDYLENTTIVADSYYHQRECLLNILERGRNK